MAADPSLDVVIVGASVAGVAAADALRAHGGAGRVTLVDADPHLPYDRPPLSKQALTSGWEPGLALLRPERHYRDQDVELLLGQRAVALDGPARRVRLADGTELAADAVVLTPGLVARRLPEPSMLPGVFVLRGAHDALAVQAALCERPRLVVVGGGFIGAEAAAIAVTLGAEVTLVEAQELPFTHLFGTDVAAALARRHTAHGVRLRCGTSVDRIEGDGRVEQVVLADGQVIGADLVLLGLGAEPSTGWLAGSGVQLGDGIVCDEFGRTSLPGVYAAGDAAAWWNPDTSCHQRIEHWTTAKEQGTAVGHNLLGQSPGRTVSPVPYFWSDQYGGRLQFLGTSLRHDRTQVVHGDLAGAEFVVLYGRDGVLTGALGLSAARHLMPHRLSVARRIDWAAALASDGGTATAGSPATAAST